MTKPDFNPGHEVKKPKLEKKVCFAFNIWRGILYMYSLLSSGLEVTHIIYIDHINDYHSTVWENDEFIPQQSLPFVDLLLMSVFLP